MTSARLRQTRIRAHSQVRWARRVTPHHPRLGPALLLALLGLALPPPLAGAASIYLSDQNRDGVVDLQDLALFSQAALGQDWQTVDWCQWLQQPHKNKKHQAALRDFIRDYFWCDPAGGGLLDVRNANGYPTRLQWSLDGQQLYVSDPYVGSVFVYDSTLTAIGELKGIAKPLGVTADAQGNIFVGSDADDAVHVFSPGGVYRSSIGEGALAMPNDLAFGPDGNLYVADSRSRRVRVYHPGTGLHVRDIGAGELRFPVALTFFGHELYVADQAGSTVHVFDLFGAPLRSFGGPVGQGSLGYKWKGRFVRLQSLGMDASGRLHAVDSHMNKVQMLDPVTGAYLGDYGTQGSAPGQLLLPLDIGFNAYGELAVANAENHRVEILPTP